MKLVQRTVVVMIVATTQHDDDCVSLDTPVSDNNAVAAISKQESSVTALMILLLMGRTVKTTRLHRRERFNKLPLSQAQSSSFLFELLLQREDLQEESFPTLGPQLHGLSNYENGSTPPCPCASHAFGFLGFLKQ